MLNDIKKKLNNPNILCLVFFGASIIVLIERIFAFHSMINPTSHTVLWAAFEYTLAFTLPIAGWAYFCASKYAQNQENKIRAFVFSAAIIILLACIMLGQISSSFIWFLIAKIFSPEKITNAYNNFHDRLLYCVTVLSMYLPLLFGPLCAKIVWELVNGPDSADVLHSANPIYQKPKAMATGEFTCEVKVCVDTNSGKDIIIPENRRMEATLIQGATGTGKTSTLMLPMCAQDLEKKFFFKESAKKIAFEALQKGYAYIDTPYSNEEINKNFSMGMLKPIKGKEKELEDLIKDMVKCKDPATGAPIYKDLGISVVEPDGKYISDYKKVAANFGIEVLTIDPADPDTYGMNPFTLNRPEECASIIATVLKGMYDSENEGSNNIFFGQVTQQALENLAILLKVMYPRMNDGDLPTLGDMLKMLYDYNIVESMCEELKKDKQLVEDYHILVKYFEKNFYKPTYDVNGRPILGGTIGSGRRETEQFLYGATTQLDNLMRHEGVKNILCCRHKNLDFDDALATGKCIAVCTRRGELGSLLARPFGMFYILTMQEAVLRRPGNETTRIPHFLYIDEFPDFVNKETETCFTLFRKYRCAMIVAIQNLSQLARTKTMEFYKQVVVSNTKTHLIFGDTNVEDSDYWSESFGKRAVLNVGNSLRETPLSQIKPGSTGISNEGYAMSVGWTDKIKPHSLNQLGFKTLYYTYRDAKGDMKKGKGKTDFLPKKYMEKHEQKEYDFIRYVTYLNENDAARLYSGSIISQEYHENNAITGKN